MLPIFLMPTDRDVAPLIRWNNAKSEPVSTVREGILSDITDQFRGGEALLMIRRASLGDAQALSDLMHASAAYAGDYLSDALARAPGVVSTSTMARGAGLRTA